ncbi:MAG: SDR family NAD(P)-dependent oxidoreductase [Aeromicrobium sp.]
MTRFEFKGSRALVTGATGGIGQAIARALAAEGVELVLSGRRLDVLEPLAKELGAVAIAADLADLADVDRLMAEAGAIDILVANAALPASGDVLEFTPEQIDRALTVNLQAPILMARSSALAMAGRKRGHIVMIGSVSGITPSPQASLYNATKFGIRGFGLGFRLDLEGKGVGVSVVEPGFIRDAGMFVESGGTLPTGVRTSTPQQVANGVVKAIRKNKAEVVVAPAELRAGARFGSVFPTINARIQKAGGGDKLGKQMAEGSRNKR